MKRFIRLLFISIIAVIVLFIYKFPDIYTYVYTPKNMVFLGQNPWFDTTDVEVYVSAIHYGQAKHVLLSNLYTSIPNNAVLIYPFYTLLGFFFSTINPFLLFFLSSIVTGVIVIFGMYWMSRAIGLSTRSALYICFVTSLAGGFGFFLYGHLPSADMNDAITFYTTFLKPHEGLAISLYLSFFILFYKAFIEQSNHSNKLKIACIIFLMLLMFFYPYFIVNMALITFCFLFFFIKERFLERYFLPLLVLYIPAIIIFFFISNQFSTNPTFSGLLQHADTNILATIIGFGVLLPLIIYQLFFLKKSLLQKYLLTWIGITLILAILPFGPGKLFLRGIFFPLVLASFFTIQEICTTYRLSSLKRIAMFSILLILTIGTSINIFLLRLHLIHHVYETSWTYMLKDDYRIFSYINRHISPTKVFLTGEILGNQIPAFTQNRVYFGHIQQTPDASERLYNAMAFYAGVIPKETLVENLKVNNISYILWGPEEKSTTHKYFPTVTSLNQIYPSLIHVYTTGDIDLYAIRSN